MYKSVFCQDLISVIFFLSTVSIVLTYKQSKECAICRAFSKSFNDGLKRTAHHNFEGGNTLWEERKLGAFATSESRLVDIIEHIECNQEDNDRPRVKDIKSRCISFAGDHDETIEEWWFKSFVTTIKSPATDFDPHRSLHDFLCVDSLGYCCTAGTFGPSCAPCEQVDGYVCGGRGQCDGNGTREGTGRCVCAEGYSGDKCEACASNFFRVTDSSPPAGTVIDCQRCNAGCNSSCSGPGPLDCSDGCRDGYFWSAPAGCNDVDECAANTANCSRGTFCRNTAGSFACDACTTGCALCTALGLAPDSCIDCAAGYERSPAAGNECVDIDECAAAVAPCPGANERCVNKPGTFVCECLDEFTRGADGVCASNATEPPPAEEEVEEEEAATDSAGDAKQEEGPMTDRKRQMMEKMYGNMKTLERYANDKQFLSTLDSEDLEFLDKINEDPDILKSLKSPDAADSADSVLPPGLGAPPADFAKAALDKARKAKTKAKSGKRKKQTKNDSKEPNAAGEQILRESDLRTEVLKCLVACVLFVCVAWCLLRPSASAAPSAIPIGPPESLSPRPTKPSSTPATASSESEGSKKTGPELASTGTGASARPCQRVLLCGALAAALFAFLYSRAPLLEAFVRQLRARAGSMR